MRISLSNSGSGPPPKPWERAGSSSSGPAPFKPATPGSTSDVVEASGTARPGEIVQSNNTTSAVNTLGRPVPPRPWEQQQTYGGTFITKLITNFHLESKIDISHF